MKARRVGLGLAWCGPLFTGLFLVGFIPVAGFIPPPHPNRTALEIKNLYLDDLTAIRIGMFLMAVAVALIAPFGVALSSRLRRATPSIPALGQLQVACYAIGTTVAVFIPLSAYLNLWTAFIFIPAGLMIFFKSGPFAYNGFISLYAATGCFFIWVMVMSGLTIQSIRREGRAAAGTQPTQPGQETTDVPAEPAIAG